MKQFPSRHESFTDGQFQEFAENSTSIINFMKKLGYSATSSYPKQVKPRCDKLGIKIISKFVGTRHNDDELRKAAQDSKSVTGVMVKLGLKPNGFAHARFRDRLNRLGITFTTNAWNRSIRLKERRSIDDYLVLNGPLISSSKLRRRLIKTGLKPNHCEECGLSEWHGKKLPLQLEHCDGNRRNNIISNLKILCPNCHSLTPTHSRIKVRLPPSAVARIGA